MATSQNCSASSTSEGCTDERGAQRLSILGVRYFRFLTSAIDPALAADLPRKYRYVCIYSYAPAELTDYTLRIQPTPVIRLALQREEIFAKFKDTTRNEIRRTERLPELTFVSPDPNCQASYQLYYQIKRNDGVRPDLQRQFTGCLFFNAYWQGALAASISCYDSGVHLRLKHIVSRRKESGFEPRIAGYATRRLIWDICCWGKAQGRAWVDLGGINLVDPTKRGINAFKGSFGGDVVNFYIYRYESLAFKVIQRIVSWCGRSIN